MSTEKIVTYKDWEKQYREAIIRLIEGMKDKNALGKEIKWEVKKQNTNPNNEEYDKELTALLEEIQKKSSYNLADEKPLKTNVVAEYLDASKKLIINGNSFDFINADNDFTIWNVVKLFLCLVAYDAKYIEKLEGEELVDYINEQIKLISKEEDNDDQTVDGGTNTKDSKAHVEDKEIVNVVGDIKIGRKKYEDHEIHNILICLIHGFINVLSGPPGCGKTSICNILAASMGLSVEENTYVPVSVGRNWNDTGDLLGYYNPFSNSMNGTPLYAALTKNNESNKAPLMVLLDESNLSSMEYYWSDFMGMCDDKKGSISIKGSNAKVEIHDNVRFVATINNDETTERLSPRLIDRSWIITLPDNTSGEEIWSMGNLESEAIELTESVVTMESLKKFYQPQYKADSTQETDYTEAIKGCFEYPNDPQDTKDGEEQKSVQISVTDILKDLGIELSARSRQAIIQYVAAAMSIVDDEDMRIMNKKLIMDYVLMQKVLPKINGYGEGYRASIENLKEVLNHYFKEVELSKNEAETSYRTVDYLDKVLKKGETTKYYTFFM